MNKPDRDGYWLFEKYKGDPNLYFSLRSFVNLSKNEVYLPTSEHPYRLSDLTGDLMQKVVEWTYLGETCPTN